MRGSRLGPGQRLAGNGLPFGVEPQELVGHLNEPASRRAAWSWRRSLAAESIELGRPFAARPFLNLVQPVDRQVELVAPRVLDDQEIDREAADVLVQEPEVFADAVLDVHERESPTASARRSSRNGLAPFFELRSLARWTRRPKILLFGDQDERFGGAIIPRARAPITTEVSAAERPPSSALGSKRPGRSVHGRIAMADERQKALPLGLGACREKDREASLVPRDEPIDERVERPGFPREARAVVTRALEVSMILGGERRDLFGGHLEGG